MAKASKNQEQKEKEPKDSQADSNTSAESVDAPQPEKETSLIDALRSMITGYGDKSTEIGKTECAKTIQKYLRSLAAKHACAKKYNVIILYDDSTLVKSDADRIYNAVTGFTKDKPILLVLFSRGGSAASAYLIGKLCREYSKDKFVVTVPRFAKSAATLICCGADEIHMGSLSELGPIDPQINDMPALGLKNAIQHIAELVRVYPESSDMFAKYLQLSLPLINLGYYERVAESAKQYAERLLSTHMTDTPERPLAAIAKNLVYKYKDHGFVIDKGEADSIFGDSVIKTNTPEYEFGNALYQTFAAMKQFAAHLKHLFYFIGNLDSEPTFTAME